MKTIIILFIYITFSSSLIFAQSFRIKKIIDTNLFELDNNQKVKFYGLYLPSLQNTNQALVNIAKDIYQWEKDVMLDRKFKFDFIIEKKGGNSLSEVIIYKSYIFSDENIANRLLSMGYAVLINNIEKKYFDRLIEYQKLARKNSMGIWKESNTVLSSIDAPIYKFLSPKKEYEQPYIPLLAISVASFALAWNSFSDASNIQKAIDFQKRLNKNFDSSELESSKSRKSIVGITCLIAGVITTLFSFKSVEVKTNLQTFSLSYQF